MAEITKEMFNDIEDHRNKTINDYLLKNEKILWRERPNVKAYVASKVMGLVPFALIWLIFDLSIIISILTVAKSMPTGIIIFLLVFFAFHLAPVWICISNIIKAKNEIKYTEYFITNKRVLVSNLPVDLQIKEVNIKDINGVILDKRVLDKFLKVGDITILNNTDEKMLVLYDIAEPEKIYSVFNKIKEQFENLKGLPEMVVCEYCGSTLTNGERKCSSCGAVIK